MKNKIMFVLIILTAILGLSSCTKESLDNFTSTTHPTTPSSSIVPDSIPSIPTTLPGTDDSIPTNPTIDTSTITKFQVIFWVDGVEYTSYEILTGEYVDIPASPQKEGYDFVGWYTDLSLSTQFDFTTKISDDLSLYASFKKQELKTCEVTFFADGKEFKCITVNIGSRVTEPESPQKEGYEFAGWYTDSSYTTLFSFSSSVNQSISLYAKFNIIVDEINIIKYGSYFEGAFVEFQATNDLAYNVYYKGSTSEYIKIDSELIRIKNDVARADILGLAAGKYSLKIEASDGSAKIINDVDVTSHDRSGYAHFNNSIGVGAYNNDGTLKQSTIVVYVNEQNKNTVTATINGKTYTGLVAILQAQSKSNFPLNIRIIGTIAAATWNPINYGADPLANKLLVDKNGNIVTANKTEEEIISEGINTLNTSKYTKLNGLSNRLKYSSSEYDSYWNMCDVSYASNVTVEGVGENAMIFQWGFTWKSCNSIEVRNLIFDDYTEDACSFEGDSKNISAHGKYWVHNNTINQGINYWDVVSEQDKHFGDGGIDLKNCTGTTISYNKFNECKKTGLVGGSDSVKTMNVTFHHNYYNKVGSRLPLGRQANMHIYNNYYYACGTAQDIRANAFVLSESNYFENVTNPQKVTKNDTYTGTVIKSYNDYLTGCGKSQATIVSVRDEKLSGACNPNGTNLTNFDTNSNYFYYDSLNKKSNVAILNDTLDVPSFVKKSAGAITDSFIPSYDNYTSENTPTVPDSGEEDSPENSNKMSISFNDITSGKYTSSITSSLFTIKATSEKFINIIDNPSELVINDLKLTKYLSLGGGGNSSYRSVHFSTQAQAKITVYFAANAGRVLAIYSNNKKLEESIQTTGNSNMISHTYNIMDFGEYYIASTNSGINLYCILIEYI